MYISETETGFDGVNIDWSAGGFDSDRTGMPSADEFALLLEKVRRNRLDRGDEPAEGFYNVDDLHEDDAGSQTVALIKEKMSCGEFFNQQTCPGGTNDQIGQVQGFRNIQDRMRRYFPPNHSGVYRIGSTRVRRVHCWRRPHFQYYCWAAHTRH